MTPITLKKLTVFFILFLQTTWINAQEWAIFRPRHEGTEWMEPRKMIAQVVSKEPQKALLTGTGFGTVYAKKDSLLFFQKEQITNAKEVFEKKYKLYAQKGINYQSGEMSFHISDNRLFMYIELKKEAENKKAFYEITFNKDLDISTYFVYNGEPRNVKDIPDTEWNIDSRQLQYISGDIRGWYAGNMVFTEDTTKTNVPMSDTEKVSVSLGCLENDSIDKMIVSQTGKRWFPSMEWEKKSTYKIAEDTEGTEDTIFDVVETDPRFPGGEEAYMNWLTENIKYPSICVEQGIQGRVYAQFVVNKDGSITDIEIVKSPDPYLSQEVKRLLANMPKWEPGTQRGRTVRVKFSMPIMFRLTDNSKKRR